MCVYGKSCDLPFKNIQYETTNGCLNCTVLEEEEDDEGKRLYRDLKL